MGSAFSTFDAFKQMRPQTAQVVEGEDLKALQRCLLTILDDISAVCSAEQIVWMLGGGSVLGAVRHRGFIPWDDDLDINMPRREWPRFRKAFLERFGDRYAIYEPGRPIDYPLAFPRIRLRGTRVVTREDLLTKDIEPGAFVDFFLMENVPNGAVLRGLHGLGSLALGFLYSCRKQFSERRLLREWGVNGRVFRLKRCIGLLLAVFPLRTWTWLWDWWNRLCRNDASLKTTFPVGRRHYFGELASREGLYETGLATFEGRRVPIPLDSDSYLTRLYGAAYMTPPPESRRESHVVFEPLVLP